MARFQAFPWGSQFQKQILTSVDAQAAQSPVPGPQCPTCGREMHLKGPKAKGVETRTGDVTARRDYYCCSHCEEGLFPPRPPAGRARKALE